MLLHGGDMLLGELGDSLPFWVISMILKIKKEGSNPFSSR